MTLATPPTIRKTTGFGTVEAVRPVASADARDPQDQSADRLRDAPDTRLPVPAACPDSGRSNRITDCLKPQAALVAHLIATHLGLPQTRTLRRAGTTQAESAYRLTEALAPRAAAWRDRRV